MSVFSMAGSNPALPTYPLQRSVRLRLSASAYFNRTPATATNRRTFTWSGWVKRGILGTISGTAMDMFGIRIDSNNQFRLYFNTSDQIDVYSQISATIGARLITNAVYRDPSAWYHIVLAVDTTNATAGDRMRLYVNGVEVTSFNTDTQPSLNYDTYINTVNTHYMGYFSAAAFDGYLEEINFIDGQALTPSSFGAYNSYGVWSPAKYTGTYGTNGFYLNFQDNSALTTTANIGIGKDSSGNGNYWTSNNISITAGVTYDSMLDVPTLTSATNANYCVGNPLNADGSTWTNANLNFSLPNSTNNAQGTVSVTSGKFYWEVVYTAGIQGTGVQEIGLRTRFTNGIIYAGDGTKYINGTNSAYGATYTTGDVIGVALDMTGGTVTFYKNNVSQGAISISGSGMVNATFALIAGGGVTSVGYVNFGQRPFSYTPPTGFNRLCTYNLPDSIVPVGAQYFAATTYTGTGVAQNITNTVNGFSMQPDLVWVKARSFAYSHRLANSITGATNYLDTAQTVAEFTDAGNSISSFNSNGFGVGTYVSANNNTTTYVGWQWRASNASAVTNTSGTITSSVSANQTAGFSIVTYTGNGTAGATVGHGLGVIPAFVIYKARSATSPLGNWITWHKSISQAIQTSITIQLNTFTGATYLNATNASSTYGFDAQINGNGSNFVAYCFAAVPGYSAFGSYTGNGLADGVFVYCGFRPRFVMLKRTDNTGNWTIQDTSRNPSNVSQSVLYPNVSNAETTSNTMDFLSNGFKLRSTSVEQNGGGATYIYACFAENPFKNSLAC
jgi:hypothetical protein